MKTLSVIEAAACLEDVLEELEREQEEVTLVRGDHAIARIVPEPAHADAFAVFGDLHGKLDKKTGNSLASAVKKIRQQRNQKLNALRNPWAS